LTKSDDAAYQYRGARAMVMLHEKYMREFWATWQAFAASGIPMPATTDPAYESPQALLQHVLRAARGYMTWMCEKLGLPDPQIDPVPEVADVEARAQAYLEHVLSRWQGPLHPLTEERSNEEYASRWGVTYCIDGMLEHAVMHPIRHTFQLKELMGGR
jgi:uncharacterized damage-inducible protein DinB